MLSALREKRGHVPYRDSKLTSLLTDSLGGSARTIMVACVSAEARDQKETLSTLHYASVARQVVNTVALAQDPQQAKVAQLEAEIARLR